MSEKKMRGRGEGGAGGGEGGGRRGKEIIIVYFASCKG